MSIEAELGGFIDGICEAKKRMPEVQRLERIRTLRDIAIGATWAAEVEGCGDGWSTVSSIVLEGVAMDAVHALAALGEKDAKRIVRSR